MDRKKVVFELVEDNAIVRRPCFICGGYSEKSQIVCEVREGLHKGKMVCEFCVQSQEIDDILKGHIESLETRAAILRSLIGRVEVPTWEQWEDKFCEVEREAERRYVEAQNK